MRSRGNKKWRQFYFTHNKRVNTSWHIYAKKSHMYKTGSVTSHFRYSRKRRKENRLEVAIASMKPQGIDSEYFRFMFKLLSVQNYFTTYFEGLHKCPSSPNKRRIFSKTSVFPLSSLPPLSTVTLLAIMAFRALTLSRSHCRRLDWLFDGSTSTCLYIKCFNWWLTARANEPSEEFARFFSPLF